MISGMKRPDRPPPRKKMRIVVDSQDLRMATVMQEDRVIFKIKTDDSGMHPAVILVAMETHLKTMTKGTTGIVLWNGTGGKKR